MRFTKMHGIGNDYVYVNGFEQVVEDPTAIAPQISDRHFGVGADGLILILPPADGVNAHVRMRMFNADGSESEMCGNGIRCVCKFAHDHGLTTANPMRIQTGNGVLTLQYHLDDNENVSQVTVDMGVPELSPDLIPFEQAKVGSTSLKNEYQLKVPGSDQPLKATFVSMGNPHAVFFHNNVAAIELEEVGPKLEGHQAFPNRINTHFVQIHLRREVTMRTWERGTGITLACGTGACAVCVAGVLTDRTDRSILAHLPGGDLHLEWRESDNHVYMTGPATEVFNGYWSP